MKKADPPKLTPDEFIEASGAAKVLQDLKSTIGQTGKPFVVSGVVDDQGLQYVDLVQQGGGVWGIALIGATYILEEMGIRFFSLAGTSAGAINTMMLAAAGPREQAKAKKILQELLDVQLFSFVDGKSGSSAFTKWIKHLIQRFVTRKNYPEQLEGAARWLVALLTLFSFSAFIAAWVIPGGFGKYLSIPAIVMWIIVIITAFVIAYRITRLAKTGYGLNKGDAFHEWMTGTLKKFGVSTVQDLKNIFNPHTVKIDFTKPGPAPQKVNQQQVAPPDTPMLAIITSDITTGNKIQFPAMWDLYWDQISQINPSDFVRASMSIPVFYEAYKLTVVHPEQKNQIWTYHLNWKKSDPVPPEVKLIDGGALSNFPINVFYNPDYIVPRMPTFGIRLGSGKTSAVNLLRSIGQFVSAIIATIKSSTDKEFINKNKAFDLGVMDVDLEGHSWLNFFLEDEEKQQLFLRGAEEAAIFLKQFDWVDYKLQRQKNYDEMERQRNFPNNW